MPKHFRFAFLLILSLCAAAHAFAQVPGLFGPPEDEEEKKVINQYDKKYKADITATAKDGLPPLLNAASYTIHFVNKPDAPEGQATLRITQPVSVNGCAVLTVAEPEIVKSGSYMSIKIAAPELTVDKSVRYAHYECKQDSNFVQVDVPLNRNELIGNNVHSIALKSLLGTDNYLVKVDKAHIALTPRTSNFFKPQGLPGRVDPLVHWFYPENTVILSVPEAPADKDFSGDIKKLAHARGLTEAKTALRNFTPPVTDKNTLYFVDQTGRLAQMLSGENPGRFGTVTAAETWQGPQGPYLKPRQYEVQAKRPGPLQ